MIKATSSFPDVKNPRHAVPIVIAMCAALLLPVFFPGSDEIFPMQGRNDHSSTGNESDAGNGLVGTNGYFTRNDGQMGNDSIHFIYSGDSIAFLESAIRIRLENGFGQEKASLASPILISFDGTNPVIPEGVERLSHDINFYHGNDSSKWITGVPNFNRVIYQDIYEDIDLIYYSTVEGLKYDFIVHPFADPGAITMRCSGMENIGIDTHGNLEIETAIGAYSEEKPYVYQTAGKEIRAVPSGFFIDGNTVSFWIGDYDPSTELIIDPLVYSTFIGGNDSDLGHAIAVDHDNNVYVTGRTQSSDFPITAGRVDDSFNNYSDVFVCKLGPGGKELLYSTYIGGNHQEWGSEIDLDQDGNIYVTGWTKSDDFPVTEGCLDDSHNGEKDAYFLELSPGGRLIYSTFIGGSESESGYGLAIDGDRNVYLSGYTSSPDFPTTAGCLDDSHNGNSDVYALKLSHNGTSLVYSTYIGGNDSDNAMGIGIDMDGNVYIGGKTESEDFPVTNGSFDETHNGGNDGFVLKLNPDLSGLVYSTFIGGRGHDHPDDFTIDSGNNAYLVGMFTLTDDGVSGFPATPGCFDDSHNGGEGPQSADIFVSKFNPNGTDLVFSTYIGGSDIDYAERVVLDRNDNIYIAGKTDSKNFPTTKGCYDDSLSGWSDAIVCKLDPNGRELLYSTYLGGGFLGAGSNYAWGIALDRDNDVYITGWTDIDEFPTTSRAYDRSFNGEVDAFVAKLELETEDDSLLTEGHIRVILIASPALALGAVLAAAWLSEAFRFRLFKSILSLYTRLNREKIEKDIEQQNMRGRIFQYIADKPGINFTSIKRELQAGHGTAIYHLTVLQREGYIRSAIQGKRKLFWAKSHFPGRESAALSELQRQIVDLLETKGKLPRTEIAARIGIPMPTLHVNIHKLTYIGMVVEENVGKHNLCSLRYR